MEVSLANRNGRRDRPNHPYKRKWNGESIDRRLLLSLSLLDIGLLIVAATMAIMCARVGEKVPSSGVSQLLNELEDLQGHHLKLTKDAEQTKLGIAKTIKNRATLMQQIKAQQNNNNLYWEKMEALKLEKSILQSNVSALEGSCGKCLDQWIYFNSSCYFFSYISDWQLQRDWERSRADCIGRAADLVVIDSEEEQVFVTNIIQTMTRGTQIKDKAFWVGLSREQGSGEWRWVNNATELHRMIWRSRSDNENCALTYYVDRPSGYSYSYYSKECTWYSFYWICETQST